MRKSVAIASGLLGLAVLLLVLLVVRHSRIVDTGEAETETADLQTVSGRGRSGMPFGPGGDRNTNVSLSLETLRQAAEDSSQKRNMPPLAARARDAFYERLFVDRPRDQKHEEEILARLRDAFSDKPGVSVGEVACNAEFCRAEILGSAEANLLQQHGRALLSSVNPKGLTFFVTDGDETGTKATCYFGRDASWKVPDFGELYHLRE